VESELVLVPLMNFMVGLPEDAGKLRTASDVTRQRAERAVARLFDEAGADTLGQIAAAPSDFDVLALLMSEAAVEKAHDVDADPLVAALARGALIKRELLARAGDTLSGQQMAEMLGVSRQSVDQRRQKQRLLGLRQGEDWAYPAFQLANGDVLPGLPETLKAVNDSCGWVALEFLLTPHPHLGDVSPIAVLARGGGVSAEFARLLRQHEGDGFA
jgi:hypothetical protein